VERVRFAQLDAVDFVVLGLLDEVLENVVELREGMVRCSFGPYGTGGGCSGLCRGRGLFCGCLDLSHGLNGLCCGCGGSCGGDRRRWSCRLDYLFFWFLSGLLVFGKR
jgi:hypothetical protein